MTTVNPSAASAARKAALHREVECLSDEVARLRLMVARAVKSQEESAAQQRTNQQHEAATQQQHAANLGLAGLPVGPTAGGNNNGPMAVLPQMFSGPDGTARLFKVMMEAYPWLVPKEMSQSQELVNKNKHLEEEVAGLKAEIEKKNIQGEKKSHKSKKSKKKETPPPSSSSDTGDSDGGSVSSTSSDDKESRSKKKKESREKRNERRGSAGGSSMANSTHSSPMQSNYTPKRGGRGGGIIGGGILGAGGGGNSFGSQGGAFAIRPKPKRGGMQKKLAGLTPGGIDSQDSDDSDANTAKMSQTSRSAPAHDLDF